MKIVFYIVIRYELSLTRIIGAAMRERKYVKTKDDDKLISKVKSLMKAQDNMTQEALASVIGKTQSRVSGLLNGTAPFQVDELIRIADYFGVSIDSLLDRDHPRQQEDISPREVCEMLLLLSNKGMIHFEPVKRSEECVLWNDNDPTDFHSAYRDNYYSAFFFSNFLPITSDLIFGNENLFGSYINKLIGKMSAVQIVQNQELFDKDTADDLIKKCLDDVPDAKEFADLLESHAQALKDRHSVLKEALKSEGDLQSVEQLISQKPLQL